MEPFAVQCATCGARLKVRDAAAIGQILGCPKCGSMVQVTAPAGWVAPTSETPAKTAVQGSPPPAANVTPLSMTPSGSSPKLPLSATPARGDSGSGLRATAKLPEPAKTTSLLPASDSGITASNASGDVPGDMLDEAASTRRKQRIVVAAGVLVILLLGIAVGLVQRTRRRAASQSPVAAQRNHSTPPGPAIVKDVESPTLAEPESQAPPVIDPRYLPSDARLLWSFDLAAKPDTSVRTWFQFLSPLWRGTLRGIDHNSALEENPIVRFTWVAASLDDWDRNGVAIIEFHSPLPTAAPLVADSQAMEWKLHEASVYAPPSGDWPHPYAVIGTNTLITGPEVLLAQLAGVPTPSVAASPPAPELPAEPETPAEDAPGDTAIADAVEAETNTETNTDVAGANEAPSEPVSEKTELPIPTGHGMSFVLDVAGDATLVERWLPASLHPNAENSKTPWQGLRTVQLLADPSETGPGVQIELRLSCENEGAAQLLEPPLLAHLAAIQRAAAKLLAPHGDGEPPETETRLAARMRGESELAKNAVLDRKGNVLRIFSQSATAPLTLGMATLGETPAIEGVRQPLALELGEPRMKQLAAGLAQGSDADQTFPAAAAGAAILPADTRLSWIATLLPFYGHDDWRGRLNMARSWNDAENQPVTRETLPAAVNPLFGPHATPAGYPVTHYVGISGVGPDAADLSADDPRAGIFGNQPRRRDAVRDGAANTIAVMGVREKWGPWSSGGSATVRPLTTRPYVNGPDGFGTGQADGMLVGMADGSVRFVSSGVDPQVLEQLVTINGGEPNAIAALEPVKPQVLPGPADPANPPADAAADPAAKPADPALADEPARPRGGGMRKIDVAARLEERIPAVDVQRMALADFLALVEQLTTLPVALDFQHLPPGAAQLPITAKVVNLPVKELFSESLKKHGLGVVQVNDDLLVRSLDAGAGPVSATLEVADLAAAGGPAELVGLIEQMVAPATWKSAGGVGIAALDDGKLVIEQTPEVQRAAADFLDRLRVARSKTKLPPAEAQARLMAPSRKLNAKLRQNLTVNFLRDTKLLGILSYLGDKADVEVAVDWPALHAVETGPDVLAELHVENTSFEAALTSLLEPMGLAFIPLEGNTLQITTPARLAQSSEIGFYPLRPLAQTADSAKAIVEKLKAEVSPSAWQGTPPLATAALDGPSRALIVRAAPPVQREVAAALEKLKGTGNKPKSP